MRPATLDRLRRLREQGYETSSRMSRAVRAELASLFAARILEDRRQGGGRRVWVADPVGFENWIEERLPHGLEPELDAPPRGAAVASWRDAKVTRRTDGEPVLMRSLGEAGRLVCDGETLDAASLTTTAGCVSIVLDEDRVVKLSGRIGLVENLEAFLYAERLGPQLDLALYSGGRLSRRVLEWLSSQEQASFVHLGDYDPVGLSEYLRVTESCDRAELWVPSDLEHLVRTYGKPSLMEASTRVWAQVRRTTDSAVRGVVEVLDRYAMGLEQEVLLVEKRSSG